MTNTPQRSCSDQRVVCPTCGGSGTLRLGDQSFRTCLDCLGQGSLPALEAAETTAAVRNESAVRTEAALLAGGRTAGEPRLRNAGISAAR